MASVIRGSDNFDTASSGDNTPSFMAKLASNQSVAASTWTKGAFATELWDSDAAFDSSSNYRFTVPSNMAGKYTFHAGYGYNGIGSGITMRMSFKLNGGYLQMGNSHIQTGSNADGECKYTTSVTYTMAVGDYMEVFYNQADGSSANDLYANTTFFSGYRLTGV